MFLFRDQVLERTALDLFEFNNLMVRKRFPLPVKDTAGRTVWWASEVDEWIRRKNNRR